MKKSLSAKLALIGALAFGSYEAWATVISYNDLPQPVQREVQTELKNGPVKKVERLQQNGQTIYAVTLQKTDGSNKYVFFDANGSYLHGPNGATAATAPAATGAATTEMQLSQLPQAVQRTIQTETKNGPVNRIVQMPNNGTTMYEVFFKEPNGQEKTIYLNTDGTYVQNGAAKASGGRSASWDSLTQGQQRRAAVDGPLTGPQSVTFGQLPPAVQNALRSQAGPSAIQNIQSGQLNGQTVYQASVSKNGQPMQVRINSGGQIVSTSGSLSSAGTAQP